MANANRTRIITTLEELIPNATITKELVDSELQCAVCLDTFNLNETGVRRLPCRHLFHAECIFPWLQNNASCPVCRARLPNGNQSSVSEGFHPSTIRALQSTINSLAHRLEILEQRMESLRRQGQIPVQTEAARPSNQTATTSPTIPSHNVNTQTNRTPPLTVVSSARTSRHENAVAVARESLLGVVLLCVLELL